VTESLAVLVLTSRVAGDPLARGWRSAISGHPMMTIDLAPLRREEAEELAGAFLDITSQIARNCVERASGNPLFLEQLLRSAEETAEESVPGSVQSIVLARVDTLEPADKHALQAASILGQRFPLDALRHLVDNPGYTCSTFIEHNLVRPEGEEYLFSHALIQEGVLSSLLKAKARELHRRAAHWFAGRDPVLRAEHLERAGDPEAPRAYLEAAEGQAVGYRYGPALRYVEQGLALATAHLDQYALTCAQGEVLHDLGSIAESVDAYRAALELAQDDIQRCRAWIGLAAGMRVTADHYQEAFELLNRAQEAATGNGLTLELARIHHLRGNLYFPRGDQDGCLKEHELALAYARQGQSPEWEARALGGLGDAYYLRGRMRTANDHFRQCIDLCRQHGLGRIEVGVLSMLPASGQYFHNVTGVMEDCLAAAKAARQVGDRRAEMVAGTVAGQYLCVYPRETALAKEQLERTLALARFLKVGIFEASSLSYLGRIALDEGNRPQALQLAQEALEICRASGMSFIGAAVLGSLALIAGDPDTRIQALEEGERVLRQGCVGHNYPFFYRDAMEVSLQSGDWEGAERYATALEEYTQPEPLPLTDFLIARGRALAAHGRGLRDQALNGELTA
ncbi:MAG: tetratricopeptide repeat protein, partial [Planctomycetota bacterium]|jgi:tetratricopeptide (TPR) repeat protein